ncbi:putative glycosyl hydrolase [Camillea tinctor]|nr:putative glycosyl hydrolase [Camillea tinctor]
MGVSSPPRRASMRSWLSLCFVYALFISMLQPAAADTQINTTILARARAAIDDMMTLYDETTGRWETAGPWWHNGLALQAVLDYTKLTGDFEYMSKAKYTVEMQRQPLDWWPEGGGNFRADSTDDTGWWALAMITMYEVTGDTEYLDIAMQDEAYMYNYWDTTTCFGGLIWSIRNGTYHNAISNELYLELTATLHNLIPGDTVYLSRSLAEWEWFKASGMINRARLVNDGLSENSSCTNNGMPTWTYNQGVILRGLAQLHKATRDQETPRQDLLPTARAIADATISRSGGLVWWDGTLTEPCATAADCEPNGTAFKGIFMRGLAALNDVLDDHPYDDFIANNARLAYANARNGSSSFYGFSWRYPYDETSIGRQVSAVDLLLAATTQHTQEERKHGGEEDEDESSG